MGDYLIHQYDSIYGRQNIIIAHRGYWKSESEKNTKAAFIRAFDNGFGVETDLRDIKMIVFPSTVATYGEPEYVPIDENHPQKPINPYGKTKLQNICNKEFVNV